MSRDPNRKTIRLRAWREIPTRFRITFVNGNLIGATRAQSFERAIRYLPIKDRYADRLRPKDMEKVALLNMAEPFTYIEGVGIYKLIRSEEHTSELQSH